MGKLFVFARHDLAELSRDTGEKGGSLRPDSKVLERGTIPLNEIFTSITSGVVDRLSAIGREGPAAISL